MKITLPTWHAVLLGPLILAAQYLSVPGTSLANRAVAIGLIFYLAIPAIVLLVVDVIKVRQYLKQRKSS